MTDAVMSLRALAEKSADADVLRLIELEVAGLVRSSLNLHLHDSVEDHISMLMAQVD